MRNKKTMLVKIDWDTGKVLSEYLDSTASFCVENNVDFEVVLIEAETGIIDSNINTIANRYIADCRKEVKPLGVDCKRVKNFIENVMQYNRKMTESVLMTQDPDRTPIDFIAPNGRAFLAEIPSAVFSEDRIENLKYLGPDYVAGGLPLNVLFDDVLSAFYWFLYKNDLFDDEKCNDLMKYRFGLH